MRSSFCAAEKISKVIHSCLTKDHLIAADKMVTAYIRMYSLHMNCLKHHAILCTELQWKRAILHLQTETA